MSDEAKPEGISIPVNSKTIGVIISSIVLIAGIVGTWYVNNEKIATLESKVTAMEERVNITPSKDDVTSAVKPVDDEVKRVEQESKARDTKLEETQKENTTHINNKMDQIEDVVHSTQLSVGTISQDIKNVSNDISEIKDDMRSIRNSVKRRSR